MTFNEWIREVVNTQACPNGNSVAIDDFSKDGMREYYYPKEFVVCGDSYSWSINLAHTKGRHLTTHYEIWFHGKAFGNHAKIATGTLTLGKIRKGLRVIYNYYHNTQGDEAHG